MLAKFRKKIVFINALFVGAILITACVISFGYGKQVIYSSHMERFSSTCAMFEKQIVTTEVLNYRDVYVYEQANDLVVFLFDNNAPINILYKQESSQNAQLLTDIKGHIKQVMENENVSPNRWEPTRVEKNFNLTSNKQDYFIQYVAILGTANSQFEIITAKSMVKYKEELAKTLLVYSAIMIISFIFILFLNNLLAKKAIAPAIKAQKTQAEFLAAASHELKSPIAVIQSSIEMLALDKLHHEEYIKNITSESHRMARLIDDMLTLSRMDINQLPFEKATVDTEELLLSIYEMFLPIAAKSNHAFILDIQDKELPKIFADKDRLIQVLAILLDNAFCYSKPETKVLLSATASNNKVCISVIDYGIGIADKEHVFDRFYQCDKSRTLKEHFGLGLSIACEIVKAMHWQLKLSDTDKGGATFCLEISQVTGTLN